MKKLYLIAIMLFAVLSVGAQTVNTSEIDVSLVDEALTLQALDVAKVASTVADPLLWYDNPLKEGVFDTAEISFDVFTYGDIHVLGALFSIYDIDSAGGRMYFSNGAYLGYNAMGGYFDANMLDFGLDSNFLGNNEWKNVRLQFTPTGYTMFVDDMMAFNESSTEVTIAGTLTDYSNVITFLKKADTLVFGTGSWWSDNVDGLGNYYDVQNSYLKNIAVVSINNGTPDSTKIEIGSMSEDFKAQAIDVAACASAVATPVLSYTNPFKDESFDTAKISFDVYNLYTPDSIHVLGALFSVFDTGGTGRMYFTNGSYLGYNALGSWFDANMDNYGLDTDFLGNGSWKSVDLTFSNGGYSMYVDGMLAFNQHSTDVTIAGATADYGDVLDFLQGASHFVIGTGSWWSDNTRPGGSYYDIQHSWLRDVSFTMVENEELVTGGNMEDSTLWITYWRSDNADTGSFTFNYTDSIPSAGEGGCLKVNSFGNSGAFAKQAVTITPGHAYQLTGAFKNISTDEITNSWIELICARVEPIEDQEFAAGDAYVIYERNVWMAEPYNNMDIDGTFEDDFNFRGAPYSKKFVIADTVTQTEWFILIKCGSSNGDGVATPDINYLFDEISLKDLGVDMMAPTAPANLTADSTGTKISWDPSLDNVGVSSYIIYNGETEVATRTALETNNTYTFSDLAEGSHTLGVVASDQSGNLSEMATVDVEIAIEESLENHTLNSFAVYPNPSTGQVNIVGNETGEASLEIYTLTGKMVYSSQIYDDLQIDMTSMDKGIYMLYLKTDEDVQIEKLILQ